MAFVPPNIVFERSCQLYVITFYMFRTYAKIFDFLLYFLSRNPCFPLPFFYNEIKEIYFYSMSPAKQDVFWKR